MARRYENTPAYYQNTSKKGFGLEVARNNSTHKEFPSDFIQKTFTMWYNAGKPAADEFWQMLREISPDMHPSLRVLTSWVMDDFTMKAMELDHKVEEKLDATLIEGKLDMLERQARVGRQMQEMAWNFLLENGPESARNAITLLKIGLDTEREARSVPGFLKGLTEKTDMEVVDEIKKLVSGDKDVLDLESSDVE